MSGVAIAQYLLSHNANLIAIVPAARIKPGVLPEGTPFPLISLTVIGGNSPNYVSAKSGLNEERVQITVEAATYPSVKQILALVRAALPRSRGSVNGITCDSILPDVIGPDGFDNNLMSYFQSQDFIVKWSD